MTVYCPTQDGTESEVDASLKRKFQGIISDIEVVEKEDLDLVCASLA